MTNNAQAAPRCHISGADHGAQRSRDDTVTIRKTVLHTTRLSDRLQTVADQAETEQSPGERWPDDGGERSGQSHDGLRDAQSRDAIIDALSQKIHRMIGPGDGAHPNPAQRAGEPVEPQTAAPQTEGGHSSAGHDRRAPLPRPHSDTPMFAPRTPLKEPRAIAPPLANFHPQYPSETDHPRTGSDAVGHVHSGQTTALALPQSFPVNGPVSAPVGEPVGEDDVLPDTRDAIPEWLSREQDDDIEPPRRGNTLMLCLGTMVLSILAGYGGAQFLKNSMGELGTASSPFDEVRQVSASLGFGGAETDAPVSDVSRKRTLPTTVFGTSSQRDDAHPEDASAALPDESVGAASPERDDATPAEMEARLAAQRPVAQPGDVTEGAKDDNTATVALSALASNSATDAKEKNVLASAAALSPEAETRLMERASRLLQSGDVAAARLILLHVAETGSGRAALMLAHAHDETWLDANTPGSVPGNRDMATRWYAMARERGVDDAARYLAALQARQ
ncbi:MAG: hypothetical protein AAGJ70_05445 [Pseudomonadota bacterium]